jgi:hypothetical protein
MRGECPLHDLAEVRRVEEKRRKLGKKRGRKENKKERK